MNNTETIKKWYNALSFPSRFDSDFESALQTISISNDITVEYCTKNSDNGIKNLLSFLLLCEGVSKKHEERGIPHNIIIDTFKDIVVWTETWSDIKKTTYLGELEWLKRHMNGVLFKLGRLQFCMAKEKRGIESYGVNIGDNVIEIHIPRGDKLNIDGCKNSIRYAKDFFNKYFPEFEYKAFTCHSWLLDEKLKNYLPESSNIIRFGNMFTKVAEHDSLALTRFILGWDVTEENIASAVPKSAFAQRIKNAVIAGERFHETLGIIEKSCHI